MTASLNALGEGIQKTTSGPDLTLISGAPGERSLARPRGRPKKGRTRRNAAYLLSVAALVALLAVYSIGTPGGQRPVILYVNQGNGAVNQSNFGGMLGFASSHGFNTVFFQVYRQGVLLFDGGTLGSFVSQAHGDHLKIFFALYITNSTQAIPAAIFGLGEDGVSLDMSALDATTQQSLLQELKGSCGCQTAVTTTNMASPLKPDMLVLETYGPSLQQYIRHGIVASVGVFATSSQTDYQAQFQYALDNSDGVMVFDYAGLLKAGY